MKTIPVSLILACAAFFPVAANAEPAPAAPASGEGESIHAMWEKLDIDGDDMLQFAEFQNLPRLARLPEPKQRAIFDRFDKNGDGKLTREELRTAHRERGRQRHRRLMELDADGSGGVSLDEFRSGDLVQKIAPDRVEAMFRRLDTDGDGEITPKDQPKHPNRARDPRDRRMERPEIRRRIHDRLDSDRSGALDFEEFRKARGVSAMDEDAQEALFLRLDADKDNGVSFEEFLRAGPQEFALPPRHKERGPRPDQPDSLSR